MTQKRPFGVTLFIWMVLCLSAWGLLRLTAALRWWDVLNQYDSRLSLLYLSITGVVWALVGAVLLWGMWVGKRWVYPAIPISIILWLLEYWLERIFFQAPRANLTFMISASVVLLAVLWVAASNRKTRNFLLRSEEHDKPEQDSTSA
ncbi:MAG TPA: hypothetical protein VJ785_04160 [Anaerolineales bacterium]|nr:hypothetical protein [Anaerolineales bacterium]